MKIALITGITGQAASYLSELLLEKDYTVWGLVRESTVPILERTKHVPNGVHLINGDLLDSGSLVRALRIAKPDEIYNCASASFVGTSWDLPEINCLTTGMGVLYLLEAIRKECPEARVWQASSSEMYGNARSSGLYSEYDPLVPASPYGVAKTFAHHLCRVYRESHKMFVACSINMNFESPRRGELFVTRKITQAVARIKHGSEEKLILGNVDAQRDWTHAKDSMRAAWLTLQADAPSDYVIASGEVFSVRAFCELAFAHVGLDWQEYVTTSEKFMRPSDVHYLCGDSMKARLMLGWVPTIPFHQLVAEMVDNDMLLVEKAKG